MVDATSLRTTFNEVVKDVGLPIRFRFFTVSRDSDDYDDENNLLASGNDVWVSGVVQPIDRTRGSKESVLLQQGKLLQDDQRLYVAGSIDTSGTWRVGLGSPIDQEYSMAEAGVIAWPVENVNVYKKVYIRALPNGSLAGE